MKITTSLVGPLLTAMLAVCATATATCAADSTITTTETITTKMPVVLQATIVSTPAITVEGWNGKTVVFNSPFPTILTKSVTPRGVAVFYVGPRDTLNTRRDDLLARILYEQSEGALSSGNSSDFINRLSSIDSMRTTTPSDSRTRQYHEHVRRIFNRYDKLSQDMQTTSHMGDRELAGNYGYIVY